ncbi:MAG: ribbon-helix-helix domain-containing protein [Verrucomicrobia bacterium]|nr:ribbon-helix-helix domain-containing protein [Verrucomicrobiota bacterium]MDA1068300.1 ribbon-helix-helix domain-containing protein [Verrucomicrobiota bacterium]
MRTTILLDDELAENLRKAARIRGLSFSAFIAEAGRAALKASTSNKEEPFELIVAGGGGPKPGIDLDKTSQLLAAEDEERYGS